MPGADIIAIVSLALFASAGAKVSKVARCISICRIAARPAGSQVLVVAHGRMRDGFEGSPTRIVRLLESGETPTIVLVVAEVENGGGLDGSDEISGRDHLAAAA